MPHRGNVTIGDRLVQARARHARRKRGQGGGQKTEEKQSVHNEKQNMNF
jgi:hypothetical protein